MSFVYVAPLLNKTAFKIGKANDPISRIAGLTRYYEFDFQDTLLIDCLDIRAAYKLEYLLHSMCEKRRILFTYDGGIEFFDYHIYQKLLSVVNSIIVMNHYPISRLPPMAKVVSLPNDEITNIIESLVYKIKNKRLGYNMTQKQLSKVCGVGVRTIRYLEAGRPTTVTVLVKALKALDLDYILSDLEVESPLRQRARDKELPAS